MTTDERKERVLRALGALKLELYRLGEVPAALVVSDAQDLLRG